MSTVIFGHNYIALYELVVNEQYAHLNLKPAFARSKSRVTSCRSLPVRQSMSEGCNEDDDFVFAEAAAAAAVAAAHHNDPERARKSASPLGSTLNRQNSSAVQENDRKRLSSARTISSEHSGRLSRSRHRE